MMKSIDHDQKAPQEHGNFQLQERKDLPDYQAVGYRYLHRPSGMEVCFIENNDKEQFFSFLVHTIPEDNTGVAHILEHSTLSGSAAYPVHDPFMMLDKGSVNTYMNAMTYPDKTIYLAASPLPKDWEHLFDVNADAVFRPLLRKETFEQEGVRLVDDGKGGHWEGVVFNEMQGASADHDGILVRGIASSLFPESSFRYDSGGDPLSIVHLDWEGYKAFYQKWYHPSNIRLFVYGDNDIPSLLEKLDSRYLSTSRQGTALPPASTGPWKKDVRAVYESPKEASGRDDGLSIVLSWALGSSADPKEVATLDALVDMLLDDSSCPLYKALIDSGLGEDISPESGMFSEFPELLFLVGFKGIKSGLEDQVERLILSSLQDIVDKGLDKEAIQATLKNTRFKQQEITGGSPQGVKILSRAMHGWSAGLGPFATIQVTPALDALDESLKEDPRYFEHWIEKNLLSNHHRALVSVVPSEHYLQSKQEILKAEAAKALRHDTKVENARFDLFENTPDDEKAIAHLPRLEMQDLPSTIRPNLFKEASVCGVPVIKREMFTNGIVYVNLSINADDFTEQEVLDLTLFTRQIVSCGIASMNEREVALRLKRLFGGFSVTTDCGSDIKTGKPRLYLTVQMKMLLGDMAEALAFASDLLQHSNVGDAKRLKVAHGELKGDFADGVTYNANIMASLYAASRISPSIYDNELLQGVTQWYALAAMKHGALALCAERFQKLQKKLCDRRRFSLSLCAEDASALADVEHFIASFPTGTDAFGKGRSYPSSEKEHLFKAFLLPSNVNYCAQVFHEDEANSFLQVSELMTSQMLASNELWTSVRMKGGAYGVDARADMQERIFSFISYRDPRIKGTFDDFRRALEGYAQGNVQEEEIENARISFVGTELRPQSPSQECLWATRMFLYHYDDEMRRQRREWMLSCGKQDIVHAAERLLDYSKAQDSRVVFCSSAALKKEGITEEAASLPL